LLYKMRVTTSLKIMNDNIMKASNILIIGASSGIGLALAQNLMASGNNVYTASRHQSDALAATGASFIEYNVLKDDPTQILSTLPDALNGLVYCPGSIQLKPFHRISPNDFLEEYRLNVLGAVTTLQAMLPRLKKGGQSSVVLFSTVAAKLGMPFHASIASAKAAVEGLVRSLAAEWAAQNIRVNAIAPSLTETPLAEKLLNTDAKRESADKRHPLLSIGQASDHAALAAFLLSDQARWMTGQIIGLDGGLGSLKV
jgi:3-oxoacyl-[acyl-carrier protein] reductase